MHDDTCCRQARSARAASAGGRQGGGSRPRARARGAVHACALRRKIAPRAGEASRPATATPVAALPAFEPLLFTPASPGARSETSRPATRRPPPTLFQACVQVSHFGPDQPAVGAGTPVAVPAPPPPLPPKPCSSRSAPARCRRTLRPREASRRAPPPRHARASCAAALSELRSVRARARAPRPAAAPLAACCRRRLRRCTPSRLRSRAIWRGRSISSQLAATSTRRSPILAPSAAGVRSGIDDDQACVLAALAAHLAPISHAPPRPPPARDRHASRALNGLQTERPAEGHARRRGSSRGDEPAARDRAARHSPARRPGRPPPAACSPAALLRVRRRRHLPRSS